MNSNWLNGRILFMYLLFILGFQVAHGQHSCIKADGPVYGSPDKNERGKCLIPTPENDGMYAIGMLEDSVLIMKLDLQGRVLWTKKFDIIPGKADQVTTSILDSDGMLVTVGIAGDYFNGGTIFAFRYDPNLNQILWAKEYINSTARSYSFAVIQKPNGGNFILANNPHESPPGVTNNDELLEVNKSTGDIILSKIKNYDLGGSDAMNELVYYQNFIYGVGRYTDGLPNTKMRNTIVKIDPITFNQVWVKAGHIAGNQDARLYGADLVIDQNFIYSIGHGDPAGNSSTNTKFYFQKTDLNGNLIWIKQYEFPGSNDYSHQLIKSANGFVILGSKKTSPSQIILFKVNMEGGVIWAHQYQFPANIIAQEIDRGNSQIIETGNQLFIIATGINPGGTSDLLILRTNLEGITDMPCVTTLQVSIPQQNVTNPTFYAVNPEMFDATQEVRNETIHPLDYPFSPIEECLVLDTLHNNVEATICEGESYEGYTLSGSYIDYFTTTAGCDSARTLNLTVESCQPDCGSAVGNLFGSPHIEEHGRCLVGSTFTKSVYIAGSRDDSTLLIKMDYGGHILWTKIFDIIPGKTETPAGILEDADGMIAVFGLAGNYAIGGSIFGMRYNPNTHTVLWAQEYSHSPNEFSFGVTEKGRGGNYLINNVPRFLLDNYEDAEIVEINKLTGEVVPAFIKNYHIIGTETLFEILFHDNFVYGVGRYKDVGTELQMRNTLVKLDPTNGDQIWVKMGHRPVNVSARLYGTDMVIENNSIYSIYRGDPSGMSLTNTKVYIQRTDLDGNLMWLKQYDLPGSADYCHDLVASGNDFVALTYDNLTEEYYLFKIDADGNVLWAKSFLYNGIPNTIEDERGNPLLIEAGNQYMFTGYGINASGDADLLLIRTDLNGQIQSPCIESQTITIVAQAITNPVFYDKTPEQFSVEVNAQQRFPETHDLNLLVNEECKVDTLVITIEATICEGQSYESYSEPGIYQDTFQTAEGCDSIRILILEVIAAIQSNLQREICTGESFEGYTQTGTYKDTFALISGCDSIRTLRLTVYTCEPVITYDLDDCRSYMSDGSIMDYSEFDPEYTHELTCGSFLATNLFRSPPQENKHSCTEGLEGSLAMCISALNTCTYIPGNTASAVMEFTVTPDADSIIAINGFEFFEKGPATYSWIDGPSGPNNYPRYYGIRILKNGTQIFEQHDISTSLTWALQSYDFNNNDAFKVSTTATFRIELLPYCPIGNGALVSAWDLEDIRIYASCSPPPADDLIIQGTVTTWNHSPVFLTKIILSEDQGNSSPLQVQTNSDGEYGFTDLRRNTSYTLNGVKDTGLLEGVNTQDLITLQKHLLGKKLLSSLDQFIAADVNHSGTLSVMDLLDLRKALLGIHSRFPNNTSWRMGIQPMDLTETSMTGFKEALYIESLDNAVSTVDFLGVKIGDINKDLKLSSADHDLQLRTNESFLVYRAEENIEAGIIIQFKAGEEVELEGLQLALQLQDLQIVDIKPGKIPLTRDYFNVDQDGILRVSFNDSKPITIRAQELLFSLVVRNNGTGDAIDKIETEDEVLAAEIYSEAGIKNILINNQSTTEHHIAQSPLYFEISPNPFKDDFRIEYSIPKDGLVRIQLFTPVGEILYATTKEMSAGKHSEVISLEKWNGVNTILLCRLMYNGETITRKAVKWE